MKMKTTHLAATAAFAMIASLTLASTASAAVVTAFISAPNPQDTRTNTIAQAGYGFYATTLGTKEVNQLGIWVSPDNTGGAVLAINHDIALYRYNGANYTQIAGGTVLAGGTADANGYAWVSIPTITLTNNGQGGDYYIVMASVGTDIWGPDAGSNSFVTLDASFGTRTGAGWYTNDAIPGIGNTNTNAFALVSNGGYVGPNIGYVIPEPSAALLGGLGLLALLRRRRA